ncbi:MAG: recombinase RecA [Lachnospiraceae bacterium]|nr:recombinase RecA [Ruminococcus sp.]MCM1275721.1 recombinase RecA [Lachnospiraceae bacterium]
MDKKKDKAIKPIERVVDPDAKKKAIQTAIAQIEKQFGEGTVMFMGENRRMSIEHTPTGSLMLDLALGIGGLPKGRIIEVYGAESSGKTTLCLHAVAEAQKAGGMAAFIDVEHALDPVYARALGVDVDNLLVSQPDTGEQALDIIETLVRSGALDIVVLDSVAAMATRAEIDGDMGDAHVGVQARLMSQAMRKLTAAISKTNCVAIFINQVREKIGVLYGNPETTPGGRALKFYASVRICVNRGEPIKDGGELLGYRTKCKVVKNKVAPPFKTAEFDMIFGEGISKLGEIIDCAVEFGIIKKSGSWFSYDDMKIGQGRDKVKDYLRDNKDICDEVEKKVREEFERQAAEEAAGTEKSAEDGENPESSEGAEGEKPKTKTAAKKTTKTTKKSTKKTAEPEEDDTEDEETPDGDDDDFAEFSAEDFDE